MMRTVLTYLRWRERYGLFLQMALDARRTLRLLQARAGALCVQVFIALLS